MNTLPIARKVRVAHLVSHPIQYFAPLYRALANYPDISVMVFFYAGSSLGEHFDQGFHRQIRWDVDLVEGFEYYLSARAKRRTPADGFDWRLNLSIIRQLMIGKYDAIWLHGYSAINAWAAILFGYLTRTPVFLRDDANFLTRRSLAKRAIKRLILPLMLRHVIPLHVGSSNRTFFEHYGAKRTYPFCYAVDNEKLQSRFDSLRDHRDAVRALFGINDNAPVILFCGKLVSRKGPLLLLDAFREVRKTVKCHLLFAGDGELRSVIERSVQENSIPDVHTAGFLNQSELPDAYASSDLLVLPSAYDETWGLVVNEAMNFELPIIVSNRVGCANELVINGVNGFVFEAGNLEQLVNCIEKIVCSPQVRETFGRRSRQIVSGYGVEQSAQQLRNAIMHSLEGLPALVKHSVA